MISRKQFRFGALRKALSACVRGIPDGRQQGKVRYGLHDALLSAFGCMYFQAPSLLQYQKQLREVQHRDNLETLLEVKTILKTDQVRAILDPIDTQQLRPVFKNYFQRLQRGKQLAAYRNVNNYYYCPLDGTQYFHSDALSCPHCLTANHASGTTSYSHKMAQAAIVYPDLKQVIPLMPEEIKNTDGTDKQDCELAAGKRLIPKIREDHPRLKLLIGGDDLFAHLPFLFLLRDHGMSYLLVAKPESHETLMNQIAARAAEIQTLRLPDVEGRVRVYEWINQVPLTAATNTIKTNFLRFRLISYDDCGQEKIHFANSWITDCHLTAKNVELLVRTGRSRWKIENECFNTLKNQGYHLEHNFGHGKRFLSFTMVVLTLLAFFHHQIFELTDTLYQDCRKKFGSKRYLWEILRTAINFFVFDTWEALLAFALSPTRFASFPSTPRASGSRRNHSLSAFRPPFMD